MEVTAPAYWQLSGTTFDETLEYSGQIIKLTDYDKPASLGVSITKRGNTEVLTGSQMRYDITVANGYQIINRADVGGKYQGTWQTAQATWVTIVRRLTTTPTLPKTGY